MIFTVTYRDRTGARREESIEAESRDAVFAAMKARGIVPTAVRAGVTKPRNTRNTRNAALPYIIAVAFVLLLGGGAWWWLGGDGRKVTDLPGGDTARDSQPRTVVDGSDAARWGHRATVTTNIMTAANAVEAGTAATNAMDKPAFPYGGKWRKHAITAMSATTNDTGYVVERIVCDNGVTYSHEFQMRKPPLFDHETDNLLLQMAMREPGVEQPPLPSLGNLDADFAEAITHPIIPHEEDSDEVRAKKRLVNSLRLNLKAIIDSEGISVAEALRRDHLIHNDNAKLYRDARAELAQIASKGDEEGARVYIETVNKAFRNMGIEELKYPERKTGGRK